MTRCSTRLNCGCHPGLPCWPGDGEQRVLLDGDDPHFVVASGHLVFRRGLSLYAVPFDPQKLAVSGDSIAIVEGVIEFDVSDGGTLVYRPVPKGDRRALVWVDRQGREEAIKAPPRAYLHPRISPDGTRVAVGDENVWIWDFRLETFTPLTFGPSRTCVLYGHRMDVTCCSAPIVRTRRT